MDSSTVARVDFLCVGLSSGNIAVCKKSEVGVIFRESVEQLLSMIDGEQRLTSLQVANSFNFAFSTFQSNP